MQYHNVPQFYQTNDYAMILTVPVIEAILYSQYVSILKSVFLIHELFNDIFSVEPISLARTTIKYIPNELGLLSFNVNEKVTVYSKEAGKRKDLWGVEVNFINFNFFNFTYY